MSDLEGLDYDFMSEDPDGAIQAAEDYDLDYWANLILNNPDIDLGVE